MADLQLPPAIRAELAQLRGTVDELRALVLAGAAPLPAGRVPLATFARLVGLDRRTIVNDLCSSDLQRRRRWPRFIQGRGPGGERAGDWYTTEADLRAWEAEGTASHLAPAVDDAIQRRLRRAAR